MTDQKDTEAEKSLSDSISSLDKQSLIALFDEVEKLILLEPTTPNPLRNGFIETQISFNNKKAI